MEFKRLVVSCLAFILSLTWGGREKVVSSQLDGAKTEVTKVIRRALDQNAEETEDPNIVFERAIQGYQDQFNSYLDITALNVTDKEAIDLPNFNPTYVAPAFSDILHDYQFHFETSLTAVQTERYEHLQKQDYNFDRYVALNNNRYTDLNPKLKYAHVIHPIDPNLPLTPTYPDIIPGGGGNVARSAAVAATAGIVTILTSHGLAEAAIAAFTGCISTMTTGLSVSWIPYLGWAMAVAVIVGALIGLTAVILLNWEKIRDAMNDIKAWFLEQFNKFSSFIESFFSDVTIKGDQSVVSSVKVIGDKTFTFKEVDATDVAALVSIAEERRRTKDVVLIKTMNATRIQIDLYTLVDVAFCAVFKTHINGFSSYTWYQNTARQLIVLAGSGYTSHEPEYHLHDKNKPNDGNPKYAFKHFHNYDAKGNLIERPKSIKKTHSLFGLLYWTENDDGKGTIHPSSPKN